ncbi:MAG: methyltransferase domain-containing protein [Myxococcota bacterium]
MTRRTDHALRVGTESHYRNARYYDHFYRRRKEDVRFYADLAEEHGGPVLELGAGTGRVALEIARRGVDVLGVDRMPEMLARAEERRAREPRRVRERVAFRKGDILRMRLRRRFPLVISPFNVFMHFYERVQVERALRTVRAHLTPRGRFAFDVLMPDARDLSRNPSKVYKGGTVTDPTDGRKYHYAENFQYDPVRQVQWITMAFQPVDDPDDLSITPLAHRQFFPAELETLLHYNRFEVEERYGGFDRSRLTGASESQVVVARPRGRDRRR